MNMILIKLRAADQPETLYLRAANFMALPLRADCMIQVPFFLLTLLHMHIPTFSILLNPMVLYPKEPCIWLTMEIYTGLHQKVEQAIVVLFSEWTLPLIPLPSLLISVEL